VGRGQGGGGAPAPGGGGGGGGGGGHGADYLPFVGFTLAVFVDSHFSFAIRVMTRTARVGNSPTPQRRSLAPEMHSK